MLSTAWLQLITRNHKMPWNGSIKYLNLYSALIVASLWSQGRLGGWVAAVLVGSRRTGSVEHEFQPKLFAV